MFDHILVAYDGSESSTQALRYAIELARKFKGRLRLVHVVEEFAFLGAYEQFGGYASTLETIRANGNALLAGGVSLATEAGVAADSVLFDRFSDRLGRVMAEEATRAKANLVVVGTHGRRGLGRVLVGSGAEQIVRESPVPVLVVRQH